MDKNDFDADFDFEKEYGFDPKLFMDSNESPEEPDEYSVPTAEPDEEPEGEGDFDIGSEPEDNAEGADFDIDDISSFLDGVDNAINEDMPSEEDVPEDTDSAEEYPTEDMETDEDEQPVSDEEEAEEEKPAVPTRRRRKERKKPQVPAAVTKFIDNYMAPVRQAKENTTVDENGNVRRRRKPSKAQIFKEVYLPAIIAFVALLVVLTCIVGSISNAVKKKHLNDEAKAIKESSESQAASVAAAQYEALMAEAEELATGYDYEGAIELLNSFTGTDSTQVAAIDAKKAEYTTAQSSLVEWKDLTQIANLSFHVLMADASRALADASLGGLYNRNFVSTDEFQKILEQLYAGGYVLVDYDSFISSSTGVDGKETYFTKELMLPEGKKPIMITETMVNYYSYMIDSNDDGEADAGGDGFASKLVVDDNGDIKAEYVTMDGETLTGNYDLVPILEAFIEEHPDFSYQGARAILAVSGSQGLFGYRCVTSYISTKGQSYYDEQVAAVKPVIEALREKGYTIASYTYDNLNYRSKSTKEISADITSWTTQIQPILGDVKVFVFARENGGITDYTGATLTTLTDAGFSYFVDDGDSPSLTVNSTYVRQTRLMVTGKNMAWTSSMFSDYFDCNVVLDMTTRGNVPNS